MREKGLPQKVVFKELQSRLREDLTYNSGKILGSMCNEPHTFAKRVYVECLEKNLGDPGLFPETAKLEREAIRMLGSPEFNFGLPGVCSKTMDPHKMGLAPIPAGGILFRDEATMRRVGKRVPYLAGGETEQNTLLGTRSGTSAVTVWVLLKHLGRKGYKTVVKHCMKLTQNLAEGVQGIDGVNLVTQPTINIVGIKSDAVEIRLIAQELRNKGWTISFFPNHIRIVVMPHVRLLHIENFLNGLEIVMEKLGG